MPLIQSHSVSVASPNLKLPAANPCCPCDDRCTPPCLLSMTDDFSICIVWSLRSWYSQHILARRSIVAARMPHRMLRPDIHPMLRPCMLQAQGGRTSLQHFQQSCNNPVASTSCHSSSRHSDLKHTNAQKDLYTVVIPVTAFSSLRCHAYPALLVVPWMTPFNLYPLVLTFVVYPPQVGSSMHRCCAHNSRHSVRYPSDFAPWHAASEEPGLHKFALLQYPSAGYFLNSHFVGMAPIAEAVKCHRTDPFN